MRRIFAVVDRVNQGIGHLMALGLAVMLVCTLLQVTVRFLLTRFGILMSVPWSEELARFVMIWIVFLGTAIACRKGQLIALEFLADAVRPRIGFAIRMFALVFCLVFFVLLVWLGWEYVIGNLIEHSPVMTIPMAWVYVALPICAVLMIVNTLCLAYEGLVTGHAAAAPAEITVE